MYERRGITLSTRPGSTLLQVREKGEETERGEERKKVEGAMHNVTIIQVHVLMHTLNVHVHVCHYTHSSLTKHPP